MRDQFIQTLFDAAATNPRIMLLTGDLGFSVIERFAEAYPKQFVNVGVAEQNMTGLATGLALEGRIVFTYSIANFPTLRCLEQIRNDAAYHEANVKIIAVGGGFSYGALGMSHHATEDLAILRSLPNVTVLSPGDALEARELTAQMVSHPGVCYLRLDKTMAKSAPLCPPVKIGRARVLREGKDVTIFATGGILATALEAAELLAVDGIETRVVSVHSIKPLDEAAIVGAAAETGGIVTLEEHSVIGGLGGAVAEVLAESGRWPKFFHRFGLRDTFTSVVGGQAHLRKHYGLDAVSVAAKIRSLEAKAPR